jgi:predicted CopG family antitoxin
MKRKSIIIRIPEDVYRKLKRIKNKSGASINFIIVSAIIKYLSRKNEEKTAEC